MDGYECRHLVKYENTTARQSHYSDDNNIIAKIYRVN